MCGKCCFILIFSTFIPFKYFGKYNHNDKLPSKSASEYINVNLAKSSLVFTNINTNVTLHILTKTFLVTVF